MAGRTGLAILVRDSLGAAVVLSAVLCAAQKPSSQLTGNASSSAPLTITLQDALARARANEPQYRAALTDYGVAKQNTIQSRAALLPNASYTAQFLYTEGNGTASGRFIASNAVHEYVSQGNLHQTLSWQGAAEYRLARAQEALAKARAEIATRGLVVTVTQAYYGFVVAQRKYSTAQRAGDEAQRSPAKSRCSSMWNREDCVRLRTRKPQGRRDGLRLNSD